MSSSREYIESLLHRHRLLALPSATSGPRSANADDIDQLIASLESLPIEIVANILSRIGPLNKWLNPKIRAMPDFYRQMVRTCFSKITSMPADTAKFLKNGYFTSDAEAWNAEFQRLLSVTSAYTLSLRRAAGQSGDAGVVTVERFIFKNRFSPERKSTETYTLPATFPLFDTNAVTCADLRGNTRTIVTWKSAPTPQATTAPTLVAAVFPAPDALMIANSDPAVAKTTRDGKRYFERSVTYFLDSARITPEAVARFARQGFIPQFTPPDYFEGDLRVPVHFYNNMAADSDIEVNLATPLATLRRLWFEDNPDVPNNSALVLEDNAQKVDFTFYQGGAGITDTWPIVGALVDVEDVFEQKVKLSIGPVGIGAGPW